MASFRDFLPLAFRWRVTRRHLDAAMEAIRAGHDAPEIQRALANASDFLSHNELGLALEELETVGEDFPLSPATWLLLAEAAESMKLKDRATALRRKADAAPDPHFPHSMIPIPQPTQQELDALSGIRCTYSISSASRNPDREILTVHYRGAYRTGSAGRPDATYMCALTTAVLIATYPHGLIFDFTHLDYQWGNNLEELYSVGSRLSYYDDTDLPFAVVLGDDCRAAVISLECGERGMQEPAEWMFDTFAEAWRYVDESIPA